MVIHYVGRVCVCVCVCVHVHMFIILTFNNKNYLHSTK